MGLTDTVEASAEVGLAMAGKAGGARTGRPRRTRCLRRADRRGPWAGHPSSRAHPPGGSPWSRTPIGTVSGTTRSRPSD